MCLPFRASLILPAGDRLFTHFPLYLFHNRAVVLVLVAVERLVVGSLLATEALITSLLVRTAVLVRGWRLSTKKDALFSTVRLFSVQGGGILVVGLLIWGVYAFVLDKKPEKRDQER